MTEQTDLPPELIERVQAITEKGAATLPTLSKPSPRTALQGISYAHEAAP